MNNDPSIGSEETIELTLIPGDTAEEIAANYVRMVNEAFATPRQAYSRRYDEMLTHHASYPTIREIKDKYFLEVEWKQTFFKPKDQIFDDESQPTD